ncbi:MAG: nitroreductase family protein [Lentisphaeria bacterium]|nr:nitroreductase family protein [Lentisphaeria bacterium]
MMKKTLFSLLAVALTVTLFADVELPAPQKKGGMPLMEALNARKTIRKYEAKELSLQQISDLLWAAFGVNRKDGKRTAPTAVNAQELTIFVLLKKGTFRYDAEKNTLVEINKKDLRKLAAPRFEAPLTLIIASDTTRQSRMKDPAKRIHYSDVDTGYVSQNIYLYCASAGLGTVAIGGVADRGEKIRAELGLAETVYPVLGHAVGIPK